MCPNGNDRAISPEQEGKVLARDRSAATPSGVPGEHRAVDGRLAPLELHHLLLDGVTQQHAGVRDGAALADAVRAVGGLVLDRRIPPGNEVENVGSVREVQPRAAGLEAHEERGWSRLALKGLSSAQMARLFPILD